MRAVLFCLVISLLCFGEIFSDEGIYKAEVDNKDLAPQHQTLILEAGRLDQQMYNLQKVQEKETNSTKDNNSIYDYIFNEDMQDLYGYVWIRLRVMIVIVSIYVLEMM